jgi:hypothetical protein
MCYLLCSCESVSDRSNCQVPIHSIKQTVHFIFEILQSNNAVPRKFLPVCLLSDVYRNRNEPIAFFSPKFFCIPSSQCSFVTCRIHAVASPLSHPLMLLIVLYIAKRATGRKEASFLLCEQIVCAVFLIVPVSSSF